MKHLKSSLSDLRQIFERNITVRHLAAPFVSFDESSTAAEVRAFMDRRDFDVVGVRREGLITGYVNRADLQTGILDDYFKPFEPDLLLDESANILDALYRLRESPRVYVRAMGQVSGIVTKGDLQKAAIRMWLFGMISLIEMQLLRLIRTRWNKKSWTKLIREKRLEDARKLLRDRRRRNEAIDLADCLQFCDKRDIVLSHENLHIALGFPSKTDAGRVLKQLEKLRDDLAHSQDIITSRWPGLVDLAGAAEKVLERAEKLDADSG